MESPSTWVILSPVRIPARPAGLSESTRETSGISGDSHIGGLSRETVVHPQPLQRTENPYHPRGSAETAATAGVGPTHTTPGATGAEGTPGRAGRAGWTAAAGGVGATAGSSHPMEYDTPGAGVYIRPEVSDACSATFMVLPLRVIVRLTSSPGTTDAKRRAPSGVRIETPSTCVMTSPRRRIPYDGPRRMTPSTTGSERNSKFRGVFPEPVLIVQSHWKFSIPR